MTTFLLICRCSLHTSVSGWVGLWIHVYFMLLQVCKLPKSCKIYWKINDRLSLWPCSAHPALPTAQMCCCHTCLRGITFINKGGGPRWRDIFLPVVCWLPSEMDKAWLVLLFGQKKALNQSYSPSEKWIDGGRRVTQLLPSSVSVCGLAGGRRTFTSSG